MRWLNGKGRALVNAALAILIVVLYIATATPVAQSVAVEFYNNPVYRGRAEGVIALSIAVSWNAEALPAMLDTLKENDMRVTFMVSGDWASENEALLARMVLDGHEIGTMGNMPLLDGSMAELTEDIEQSVAMIHAKSGVRPTLYYSGMRHVKRSTKAAGRLGLTHVLCTVDTLCGRGNTQDILARALDTPFDGSIILMQPTAAAATALPACLDAYVRAGYRVGTVSEALDG